MNYHDEIKKANEDRIKAIADSFEKGKKLPIGTISGGRKKVAEGHWVAAPKEKRKDLQSGDMKKRPITSQAQMVIKNPQASSKEIDNMISKVKGRMRRIDAQPGSRKLMDEKYLLEGHLKKLRIKAVQPKGARHIFGFEKGKKMPIGTVSNGRKKVGEGKWVPVKDDKKADTKENNDFLDSMYTKMDAKKIKDGASVRIDPAKQSKKELYEAVNKKYGTNFKPGSIDEFEDDSFRVQLDGLDVKEIVNAEKGRLDTF